MAERGDLTWGTIPGLIADAAERYPALEAVKDGDTSLTFPHLYYGAVDAAKGFLAAGVAPGDRVAIWAPNIWEWVVAMAGVHFAGGVLVPLNTRFKGAEAGYILAKSRAKILVTVTGFLDTDYVGLLRGAGVELPQLERIVVLRGDAPAGTETWGDFVAGGTAVATEAVDLRTAELGPEDLSDIMFTSGTTGRPKGVMATHGQTLRAFTDWSAVVGLREADRYLVVNPFFHTFGYKAGIVAALIRGAAIVPHAVFDAASVLDKIRAERITMLPGPPTLYQSILAHPDLAEHDISTLRLAVTGAASIPVSLIHRMRDELGFETVVTGYGLTEATGIATMCRHDDDPETIATTSGRAIPGCEVLVVDDGGKEVSRGTPGEVVVRGYNVMQGYFEDPEQTAQAIDAHGWLHTGDVGVMDERGNLRITDRTKDMFIVGGFNAYPAEIENLLLDHDAIAQVAVVGVPDERMGEVAAAYCVLRPGAVLAAGELIAWAKEHMANYKVPRYVEVVDTLPLNASGKVLKYELRERASSMVPGQGVS